MFCALFKTLDIMRVFLSGSSPPLCRQLSFVMDTSTSLLASKSPSIFVVRSTKLGQVIVVCVYTRQLLPTAPTFLLYGFGFTRWEMMTTAQRQQQVYPFWKQITEIPLRNPQFANKKRAKRSYDSARAGAEPWRHFRANETALRRVQSSKIKIT